MEEHTKPEFERFEIVTYAGLPSVLIISLSGPPTNEELQALINAKATLESNKVSYALFDLNGYPHVNFFSVLTNAGKLKDTFKNVKEIIAFNTPEVSKVEALIQSEVLKTANIYTIGQGSNMDRINTWLRKQSPQAADILLAYINAQEPTTIIPL